MTAEATAMHRWVLPVPVPPMKIALRLASRKVPLASSRTCPSSIGVSAKVNVSISLRTGNLAPPSGDFPYAVVAATIGRGLDLQAKRVGCSDAGRGRGLTAARQHGQDHIATSD